MSRWTGGAAGALLAVGVALLLARLSALPVGRAEALGALVRLAWRTRPTLVERCRARTEEELERVPVHMRQAELCEGQGVPFRLEVELDGRTVLDRAVRPAGARGDRPLYVYAEFPVAPGVHRLAVRFTRELVPADTAPDRERERGRREESPAPPRLVLEQEVHLAAGRIALVTYDAERRALLLKGYGVP